MKIWTKIIGAILLGVVVGIIIIWSIPHNPYEFVENELKGRERLSLVRFNDSYNGIPCDNNFTKVWSECSEYFKHDLSTGFMLCGKKQSEESCRKAQKEYYEDTYNTEGVCKLLDNRTDRIQCAMMVKNGTINWDTGEISWETMYCEYWEEDYND